MDAFQKSVLIFIGAGIGGNARYWLGGWISVHTSATFPWATLAVNLSGSLLIGVAAGLLLNHPDPLTYRLLLIVGVLGGYTTFSAFSLETLLLLTQKSYLYAVGNIVGSCFGSLLSTWAGFALAKALSKA